jgi:hypothetical protein
MRLTFGFEATGDVDGQAATDKVHIGRFGTRGAAPGVATRRRHGGERERTPRWWGVS